MNSDSLINALLLFGAFALVLALASAEGWF